MYTGTLAPRSNRAGWSFVVEVQDDETDEAVDLTGCSVVFEIKKDDCLPILSATTDNGMVMLSTDPGFFQVTFTATDMKKLCADTYFVGCTISNDDSEPQQLIIGALPVLDGIVSK